VLVRITLGYDADGKQIRPSKTFSDKTPKRDIDIWVKGVQTDYARGLIAEPSAVKTKAFLEHWLDLQRAKWRTEHTYKQTHGLMKRHVFKRVGHIKLQDLKKSQLMAVFVTMTEKGLSDRSIEKVYKTLRQALGYAVRQDLLVKDPLPVRKDLPKGADKQERHVLTTEQMTEFLRVANGSKYYTLFLFLLSTGLRIGEALALEWRHLGGDSVKVEQSLDEVFNGFKVGSPKSESSFRTIKLMPSMVALLQELPREGEYVFSGTGVNRYKSIRLEFKRLLAASGLNSQLTLHDLRDTACTLMLINNFNPKEVSSLMGHSDVAFTLNRYAHYIPEWGKDLGLRIEGIFVPAPTSSGTTQTHGAV
jgi:integrase